MTKKNLWNRRLTAFSQTPSSSALGPLTRYDITTSPPAPHVRPAIAWFRRVGKKQVSKTSLINIARNREAQALSSLPHPPDLRPGSPILLKYVNPPGTD